MRTLTLLDKHMVFIPGNQTQAIRFAAERFVHKMVESVEAKGSFYCALSGGSTPKEIYKEILFISKNRSKLPWDRAFIFWSDERCVSYSDPRSNFKMAMDTAFSKLPIPDNHIFPMPVFGDLDQGAKEYEHLIAEYCHGELDFVMLGVGEDGHTASLFPRSEALKEEHRWILHVVEPTLETERITFTIPLIKRALEVDVYALGPKKAEIVAKAFEEPLGTFPITQIGSKLLPLNWIIDTAAASRLNLPE